MKRYKPKLVRAPIKINGLDHEGMLRLGFTYIGTGVTKVSRIYRIKPSMYCHYHIQVELGPYPETNPNCGTLSIFHPADSATGFTKTGRRRTVKFKERITPVAWYVDTYDRLREIVAPLIYVR